MTSKEALEHLENAYYSERYPMSEFVSMTDLYTIKQDLERLENLEKENQKLKEIIKENFRLTGSLYNKVHYLYTTPQMQDDILEVLENDN